MSLNINTLHKTHPLPYAAWSQRSNDLMGDRFYIDDEGILWGIGASRNASAFYWNGQVWVEDQS